MFGCPSCIPSLYPSSFDLSLPVRIKIFGEPSLCPLLPWFCQNVIFTYQHKWVIRVGIHIGNSELEGRRGSSEVTSRHCSCNPSFPSIYGSLPPVTPASAGPMPSSRLREYLHSHADTQMHTPIIMKKNQNFLAKPVKIATLGYSLAIACARCRESMEVLTLSWPWRRQTQQDLEPQTVEAWRLLCVLSLEGMRTAQSHQLPFYFKMQIPLGKLLLMQISPTLVWNNLLANFLISLPAENRPQGERAGYKQATKQGHNHPPENPVGNKANFSYKRNLVGIFKI